MAAEVPDITQALADRLNSNLAVRAYNYIPDTISTPMATIWPETTDYHLSASSTGTRHTFRIQTLVGRVSERAAQQRLQDFMSYSGDQSVRETLEGDETLNGTVQQIWVTRADNVGAIQTENAAYLAVDFIVEVLA